MTAIATIVAHATASAFILKYAEIIPITIATTAISIGVGKLIKIFISLTFSIFCF